MVNLKFGALLGIQTSTVFHQNSNLFLIHSPEFPFKLGSKTPIKIPGKTPQQNDKNQEKFLKDVCFCLMNSWNTLIDFFSSTLNTKWYFSRNNKHLFCTKKNIRILYFLFILFYSCWSWKNRYLISSFIFIDFFPFFLLDIKMLIF